MCACVRERERPCAGGEVGEKGEGGASERASERIADGWTPMLSQTFVIREVRARVMVCVCVCVCLGRGWGAAALANESRRGCLVFNDVHLHRTNSPSPDPCRQNSYVHHRQTELNVCRRCTRLHLYGTSCRLGRRMSSPTRLQNYWSCHCSGTCLWRERRTTQSIDQRTCAYRARFPRRNNMCCS